ncbi:unnamed protein product [Ixodes persulcatus]
MKLPTSSIVTACVLLHRPVQSVFFAMNDVHLRRFAFPEAQWTFVRSIKCHKRNIFLYIGRDIENCVRDFSSCALDAFTDYGHSYGTLLESHSGYHILNYLKHGHPGSKLKQVQKPKSISFPCKYFCGIIRG